MVRAYWKWEEWMHTGSKLEEGAFLGVVRRFCDEIWTAEREKERDRSQDVAIWILARGANYLWMSARARVISSRFMASEWLDERLTAAAISSRANPALALCGCVRACATTLIPSTFHQVARTVCTALAQYARYTHEFAAQSSRIWIGEAEINWYN